MSGRTFSDFILDDVEHSEARLSINHPSYFIVHPDKMDDILKAIYNITPERISFLKLLRSVGEK